MQECTWRVCDVCLKCDWGRRKAARSSAGVGTTLASWASATQTTAGTRRARWQAPLSAGATLLCPDSDARIMQTDVRDGGADPFVNFGGTAVAIAAGGSHTCVILVRTS